FRKASQQFKDFQASLRSSTTTAVPGRITMQSNKTTITSSSSISSTSTTTTTTPNSATPFSPSEAAGISKVTIILTCSILGALIVIITTCTVVIIRRKKASKRSLVDPKKRHPLVYNSGQDDLSGAYSRSSDGHDNPG
ncbi:unnamed protein product, partial [Lymnaea stagnalis]